jgi:glyoxylase-like metal-dependent hydrolase (beta-lactamase superfamily II)
MTAPGERWSEVGDRVYVRRHRSLDLNVGLVVGDGACLVIDTRSTAAEARDLVAAIRTVTGAPWIVVNTHAHYDHFLGNGELRPARIWAHRRCVEMIAEYGDAQRRIAAAAYRRYGETGFAADLEATPIDAPDQVVEDAGSLGVGGRHVRLRHLGRGHTDNDLVVLVPDADVVFAGDLIEQGAPPSFGDAFPLDWPSTVDALLAEAPAAARIVPGHGAVVDRSFVESQRAELAQAAAAATAAYAANRSVDDAYADVPYPEPTAREALERAYRQLRGDPPYDPPEAPG